MEAEPDARPSPWHPGESELQRRVGVAGRMDVIGRKVIRNCLPDQHRTFYGQLMFIVLGIVDDDGNPWATVLEGPPGFLAAPDAQHLRINGRPALGDPAGSGLNPGSAVGLLGIELHTRRRNRLNGAVTEADGAGFSVGVTQSFGNCPQYIQTRTLTFSAPGQREPAPETSGHSLDDTARATIAAADTFFVASYVEIEGGPRETPVERAVDVSHRGGRPGFVRVDGDALTIPDFAGNLHFNTLGNLLLNPRAGLLFVDFTSGDLLQLTGSTELVFEGSEVEAFQGAERIWRLHVEKFVRRPGALALRGTLGEYSPNSLLTGTWTEVAGRLSAAALSRTWRPFRIARIVEESTVISSFHLEPADGAGLPLFQAGQHLPIRLPPQAGKPALIRTYTLSVAPSDQAFRISVKRDGLASTFMHDQLRPGDLIEVRAPDGGFVVDASERRPLVLISAGVGITPMLAMLRHIIYEGLRARRTRKTWFLHSARTRAERPFDGELARLASRGGGAITVVRALTRPDAGAAPGVDFEHPGRIDVALLEAVLPFGDYDFYLCGPSAFSQGLYDGLRALRIPDDRIHAEAFGPSALDRFPDPVGATSLPPLARVSTESVPVVFSRTAKEARWLPGSGTLLELAEARGLTPEFSCRGGTCGTCRTKLLAGEVTYQRRPTAPVANDECLICLAVPADSRRDGAALVLDL